MQDLYIGVLIYARLDSEAIMCQACAITKSPPNIIYFYLMEEEETQDNECFISLLNKYVEFLSL